MRSTLIQDAENHQSLFHPFGAIPEADLRKWMTDTHTNLPTELFDFYVYCGGLDFLETETILGPFGNPDLADDLKSVNLFHRKNGLAHSCLVFHRGTVGLSIFDEIKKVYCVLNVDTYELISSYATLDQWYSLGLRREYASKYGL